MELCLVFEAKLTKTDTSYYVGIVVCTVNPFTTQVYRWIPTMFFLFCDRGQRFLAHPAGRNDYAGSARGFAKDGGISNEGPLNTNGRGWVIVVYLYICIHAF